MREHDPNDVPKTLNPRRLAATQEESSQHGRLLWQCRRGMLELDLLLQDFVEQAYTTLSAAERDALTVLLTYPDQLLLEYLMGRMVPTDPKLAHVIRRIRGPAAT